MEYIAGNTDFRLHNSAVSLGKFDGLHIGHQLLIDKTISLKQEGYSSVVFSFLYNPRNLFSEIDMKFIYTEEEKKRKLKEKGLDVFISYPFSKETASMEPEKFVKEVLVDRIDAKVIVVGSDYCFGRNREGNVDMLRELSKQYGYRLVIYDKLKLKDTIVSSTLIRDELEKGNIELVNQMLGTPYSIIGEVMHGRKIGRTLGMPTTNLIPDDNKLLPPNGVYASKVIIDGISYDSVTSIGYKPSVGKETKKGVETFIFDFDDDLYGKIIEVRLYGFEREEVKFNSLEELSDQMHRDIQWAKEFLKEYR
ncbi:riboflavin kinase/FMN adenylyltransferase [Mobilisporobacter senegalensis]|uniref:Riboflavin biosynthesis protein n=1 Tax=Mobilisporobacter senegalensis TaxID=1329262 RepID=A0A3N1XW10_9FIRM|nr:bifunctional riboflavin kinase/FAD synthetase [Mobilisporobacter senegalensis]ROR30824.1 riboflavin kinase/FMN adenylyltransferase [Mobilisporobacter senegalensis]